VQKRTLLGTLTRDGVDRTLPRIRTRGPSRQMERPVIASCEEEFERLLALTLELERQRQREEAVTRESQKRPSSEGFEKNNVGDAP
jgi:hypothetical protein